MSVSSCFPKLDVFNILHAMQCSTLKSTGGPNTDRLDSDRLDTDTDAHRGEKTRESAVLF
jgi:hypothetical protein